MDGGQGSAWSDGTEGLTSTRRIANIAESVFSTVAMALRAG